MECFLRFGIPERFVLVKDSLYLKETVTSQLQKQLQQNQKAKQKWKQQMAEWKKNTACRSTLPARQCRLQQQQQQHEHEQEQQQQQSLGLVSVTAVASQKTGFVRGASAGQWERHAGPAAGGVLQESVGIAAGGMAEERAKAAAWGALKGLVGVAAGDNGVVGGGSKGRPWKAGSVAAAAGCDEARPPKHLLKQLHERVLRRMSKDPQGQLLIAQVANTAICFPKELLP